MGGRILMKNREVLSLDEERIICTNPGSIWKKMQIHFKMIL